MNRGFNFLGFVGEIRILKWPLVTRARYEREIREMAEFGFSERQELIKYFRRNPEELQWEGYNEREES